MTFDTATSILKKEFCSIERDKTVKHIIIDLLGGEPLLNFELISLLTEWIYNNPPRTTFELNVRTNGTLLSERIKNWFLENKNKINLGLSLDGLGKMQKEGRTDFPIDIDFFIKNWPHRRINIVVFNDTAQYLADAVSGLRKKGALFSVDIACGINWTKSAASDLLQQLLQLIPLYVSDPEEARESGLFKYRMRNVFPREKLTETFFCGDMTNIVAYSPDGKDYCCHMFTPIVIGKDLAEKFRHFTLNKKTLPIEERCAACPWVRDCKICFAMNAKIHGSVYKSASPQTTCLAVNALGIASSYFFVEELKYRMENKLYIAPDELQLGSNVLELLSDFDKLEHI